MSLFDCVSEAPQDPILGMTELFNADSRIMKINLGVGVYLNDSGKLPLLHAVHLAEKQLLQTGGAHPYIPIPGANTYRQAMQNLVFGEDCALIEQGRIVTVQAVGGTGGLKIGADFMRETFPNATVAISDPSWENHRALFAAAGFPVTTYAYYDADTHAVAMSAMLASLNALNAGSIVVLHACCHNPTGIDLSQDQWMQVIDVCKFKQLIPFIDMAYQGFARSVRDDAKTVRLFAEAGLPLIVANSCSKSFALYGERVGALSVVCASADEASRVLSRLKCIIRTNYSSPPTYGSAIVAAILTTPELCDLWVTELDEMRVRIKSMRQQLVDKLNALSMGIDFSFINQQNGMFSYSGLSAAHALQLKRDHGVYILPTGRICIAALNSHNIDAVVNAIHAVLTEEGLKNVG